MHQIDLKNIDLNLLVTLDALLRARHVTRAAKELGKSQSATSHALGRLRELFEDELLTPGRPLMVLTPRAEALLPPLSEALQKIEGVFLEEDSFDPATSTRVWRVACPDALIALLPQLTRALRERSPGSKLEMVSWSGEDLTEAFRSGELSLGLTHSANLENPRLRVRAITELSWVAYLGAQNEKLATALSLEDWRALEHVIVQTGHDRQSLVETAFGARGIERQIGAHVPSFLLALHLVATTKMCFTAPDIFHEAAKQLGLIRAPLPFSMPTTKAVAVWHERWANDESHEWFRGSFLDLLDAQITP